jgi:hypothetical protein
MSKKIFTNNFISGLLRAIALAMTEKASLRQGSTLSWFWRQV